MTFNSDLTPSQRIYCDVMGISYDTYRSFPIDIDMRVNRVMQCMHEPLTTILNQNYFECIKPEQVEAVTKYSEEEFVVLVNAAIRYIQNTPELYEVIYKGEYKKTDNAIANIPVTTLDLPKNIQHYLRTHGISTVGDLMDITEAELMHVNQMNNRHRVNMVKKALAEVGAELKADVDVICALVDQLADLKDMSYQQKIIAVCKNDMHAAREDKLSEEEKKRIYSAVMKVLSLREADVIVCRLNGYTVQEIAIKNSITESGARAILTKAIKRLREPAIKRYILFGKDCNKFEGVTLDDPVEELLMSGTTTNMLKREGYIAIKDVTNMTLHEFSHFDKFGPKRYAEVLMAIKERVR